MVKNSKNGKKNHTFDWVKIKERIVSSSETVEHQLSQEVLERIWAERAAKLARVPEQDAVDTRTELALVRLGREIYGLDVQNVLDIRPAKQITRVPRVPDWVAGVTNLRGRLLSVIDLVRFFGLPAEHDETVEERAYLVVVSAAEMEVALRVDAVLGVEALQNTSDEVNVITIHSLPTEYIQGVVRRENASVQGKPQLCIVLNLMTLLADQRLLVHEEIV